nr:D(2) dopamine receptor A-like [Cherax quadricarinatus]
MKSIAVLIRDYWLKNKMKANETAPHSSMQSMPGSGDGEGLGYNSSVPWMDDEQSQMFDSGGESVVPWDVSSAGSKRAECAWSSHDNLTDVVSSDLTFQCSNVLEVLTPNVSCWVASMRDCMRGKILPRHMFTNTSINPGLLVDTRTQTCLSCLRDNSTSYWTLKFNTSENYFTSFLSYGSELLCSFGSCSSALCDHLTISPSPASSPTHPSSNTSLPILPVPSLPPSTTTPPPLLHIVQCRIPDLLQFEPPLPLNLTGDDFVLNATTGSDDEGYEYDFSFLFLAMFILAGGIGNILVCLAVSRLSFSCYATSSPISAIFHTICRAYDYGFLVPTSQGFLAPVSYDFHVPVSLGFPVPVFHGFLVPVSYDFLAPVSHGYWPFGVVWCNIYVTCDVLACTSSIMHMCTISLGRYLGIRNPLKTRSSSKKTVGVKVVLVWLLAMLVTSIITVLGIVDTTNIMPADYVCTINNQTFFIFGSLCAFYIPMVIMVVSYALTVHLLRKKAKFAADAPAGKARTMGRYRSVRRKHQQATHSFAFTPRTSYRGSYSNGHAGHYEFSNIHKCEQATQTPESIARETRNFKLKALRLQLVGTAAWHLRFLPSRKRDALAANAVATEQKASKVLGIVFFAFVICWTPFFILNIYFAACPTCQVSDHLANVCLWLGYVSSTINPIIYTIFNRTFKAAFIKILKCNYNFDHRHVRSHSMSDNMAGPYGGPTPSAVATPCSIRTLSTYVKSPSYQHALTSPEHEQEHQC